MAYLSENMKKLPDKPHLLIYSGFAKKHNNIKQKGLGMEHINNASQSQANIDVQGKIDDFFVRFKIATSMQRCGIRKNHGHSVHSLTKAI